MKLTDKHLTIFALCCGIALVLFGVAKALFHFDLGAQNETWITNAIFFAAAMAFLQKFRLRRQAQDRAQQDRDQARREP